MVVEHEFSKPAGRIFDYLSEHENLNRVLAPTRVERVRDGTDGTRNGVGSARRLSFWGALPFVETVTAFEPHERIEYRVTQGTPLNHHRGEMLFTAYGASGCRLRYTIELGAAVPGLTWVVARALDLTVRRGLPVADREA